MNNLKEKIKTIFTKVENVYILGALDAEMSAIEDILVAAGANYQYALKGGERVKPHNAYQADSLSIKDNEIPVFVECGVPSWEGTYEKADHHNPGDPGYGASSEEFLKGSSIGQVFELIYSSIFPHMEGCGYIFEDGEWKLSLMNGGCLTIPHELVIIAACDHCPAAVYQGECPGVDPEEALAFKASEAAKFRTSNGTDTTTEELLFGVKVAKEIFDELPRIEIDGHMFVDGRGVDIPEAPMASAYYGVALLYRLENDDHTKEGVLNGSKEALVSWMEGVRADPKYKDVYGNPNRGYAGAYLV